MVVIAKPKEGKPTLRNKIAFVSRTSTEEFFFDFFNYSILVH